MSRLLGCTAALVVLAAAVAIAALALNIIILGKVNDGFGSDSSSISDATAAPGSSAPPPTPQVCPAYGKVSEKASWKDAADYLLRGIDYSVDPCSDFYQFTCGKYLRENAGTARASVYTESQTAINLQIAKQIESGGEPKSDAMRYQKKAFQDCVADFVNPASTRDKFGEVFLDLQKYLGYPLFGVARTDSEITTTSQLFLAQGAMERQFIGGPLISSSVSVDNGDVTKNALFIGQPSLSYPRDYYVLPQYISILQAYEAQIEEVLTFFARLSGKEPTCRDVKLNTTECIKYTASMVVDTERKIAMATWPETEMRNYKQQYNPYKHDELAKFFPSIPLSDYVDSLLAGVPNVTPKQTQIVISQPSYFAWLDGAFAGKPFTVTDAVDYLAIQFLMSATGDYGIDTSPEKSSSSFIRPAPYVIRRGFGRRRMQPPAFDMTMSGKIPSKGDSARSACVFNLIIYMPYAPGYTYAKLTTKRDDIKKDVVQQTEAIIAAFSGQIDSLQWMTPETKKQAHEKSKELRRNYLWPEKLYGAFNDNTENLDAYHADYAAVLEAKTYWQTLKVLKYGLETREFFRMLGETATDTPFGDSRSNFLQSPAMVNAWYQPERNSITFPLAALNPPYYDLSYPQAFRYAGQGGTGGHELTHGYDDEGVQFGPNGQLVDCRFTHCGIMDDESRGGFTDMAQCVVTLYNGKCCPLNSGNIRCANGATTQGENIADLGGQMAAYRAYANYTATNGVEDLLPGLEQFTPNQVFWITYGFSWCMAINDDRLRSQLMTDPHAPSSCRVNQVMQSIPDFGRDFKCKRGSELFPMDADRCKVWIGY